MLRKAPQDFEVCVDYEAPLPAFTEANGEVFDVGASLLDGLSSWVHAASPSVHCRPLVGSNGFGTPPTPARDGAHVLAAWINPLPTSANAAAFESWNVSKWVRAGCTAARVKYVTSAEGLHL